MLSHDSCGKRRKKIQNIKDAPLKTTHSPTHQNLPTAPPIRKMLTKISGQAIGNVVNKEMI
jgi:PBP1b-binding outer membrane lipoprotein LpoB